MVVDPWRATTIASDIVVAFSFVIMPGVIFSLFHKKRIGHVLDGWFRAISAVFLSCALYRILDVGSELDQSWAAYQATVFLLSRYWIATHNPIVIVNALKDAMEVQRRLMGENHEPSQVR